MSHMMTELNAKVVLGTALLRHVIKAPFSAENQNETWLAQLQRENLAATPEHAWEYLAGTSRCIGCGLCNSVASGDAEPAAWILGSARTPGDAPLALEQAKSLRELAQKISRVCPARVPVEDIARLIEDNAKAVTFSR